MVHEGRVRQKSYHFDFGPFFTVCDTFSQFHSRCRYLFKADYRDDRKTRKGQVNIPESSTLRFKQTNALLLILLAKSILGISEERFYILKRERRMGS